MQPFHAEAHSRLDETTGGEILVEMGDWMISWDSMGKYDNSIPQCYI